MSSTQSTIEVDITNHLNTTQQFNEEVPKPMLTTKKPNVVILESEASTPKPVKIMHFPATLGTLIPVQVISEPLLQRGQHTAARPAVRHSDSMRNGTFIKSGIPSSTRQFANHGCRRGQIKDATGQCRSRRSTLL